MNKTNSNHRRACPTVWAWWHLRTVKPSLCSVSALALAAAGQWYTLAQRGDTSMAASERKVLYWHDPMVPGFKSDKPGKSPFMDMQLVPVYEGEAGGTTVNVRPEVLSNLGARTYKVERAALARRLAVQGYVQRQGSEILVLADVFERGADWLRAGLPAEVRMDALPGRGFTAHVESAQPDIGVGSRSLHVVLRLDNPDTAILSNTLADVTIQSPPGKQTACHSARGVDPHRHAHGGGAGAGRRPVPAGRKVVPGAELGDWIEIVKGLNEGDTIVTSGQFLIDSEANVRASFARMESTPHPCNPPPMPVGETQR